MGTWGAGLYDTDMTCDVRDTYLRYLVEGLSNAVAYEKIINEYNESFDDDVEPLFWYALAETQWKTGRLMPEVKQKALEWIEKDGGLDLWEDDEYYALRWKKTLVKLKSKLEKPIPPEKKFRKPEPFETNPWNINDVYAFQFHGKESEKRGLLGKYILIQKISDEKDFDGSIVSRIHVFDRVFDKLPCLDDIDGVRLLPLLPGISVDNKGVIRKAVTVEYFMNVKMTIYKKSDYKSKYLTFIGNKMGPMNKVNWGAHNDWKDMDDWLSLYFIEW